MLPPTSQAPESCPIRSPFAISAAAPPLPPPVAPPPSPVVAPPLVGRSAVRRARTSPAHPVVDAGAVANWGNVVAVRVMLTMAGTDRIGTEAYNQKLSERRADAVRDYLVSKGVDKAKIEALGLGEKQPVVTCDQKNLKQLIECLQPNRRVEIEVFGAR
mgnify:CR=1 FL=1